MGEERHPLLTADDSPSVKVASRSEAASRVLPGTGFCYTAEGQVSLQFVFLHWKWLILKFSTVWWTTTGAWSAICTAPGAIRSVCFILGICNLCLSFLFSYYINKPVTFSHIYTEIIHVAADCAAVFDLVFDTLHRMVQEKNLKRSVLLGWVCACVVVWFRTCAASNARKHFFLLTWKHMLPTWQLSC